MSFVHYDGIKLIGVIFFEAVVSLESLHRAHYNGEHRPRCVAVSLFKRRVYPGCFHQLIRRLIKKLSPVCEDKDLAALIHPALCHLRKTDRLAAPCWEHKQCAPVPLLPLSLNGLDRLILVRSQLHHLPSFA